MFNVKVSLLYFLLIALSVVGMMLSVGQERQAAVSLAEASLKSIPNLYEATRELRERRMKELGTRLAASEVADALELLADFRKDFVEIDKVICSAEEGVPCDPANPAFDERRAKLADERFGETTFKAFSDAMAERHKARNGGAVPDTEVRIKKQLRDCFGRGSTRCDWEFSYAALRSALERVLQGSAADVLPDVVMVFDSQGIGLAHAQNDGWSFRSELADTVLRAKSLLVPGQPSPAYFDVLTFRETGEARYLVTVMPVVGANSRFVGAVMLGHSVTKKLVDAEQSLFGRDVTYILDDKPIESTMERADYQFMLASAKVDARMKTHLVASDDWLGVSVPYAARGETTDAEGLARAGADGLGPAYRQLRVVIAVPRAEFEGALASLQSLIPLFGVGVFVLGVVLFVVLIRNHMRPFERIDSGLHEVINGNFDYEFPYDYPEQLPSSMAQSLNLMMAVLLGKPITEDDDTKPWKQSDVRTMGEGGPASGVSEVIVASEAEVLAQDALTEPAEAYFKRLYDEFRRVKGGKSEGGITYVRFVEQVVRQERRIRTSLPCKHVRFRVDQRSGQVVLVPMVIT